MILAHGLHLCKWTPSQPPPRGTTPVGVSHELGPRPKSAPHGEIQAHIKHASRCCLYPALLLGLSMCSASLQLETCQ